MNIKILSTARSVLFLASRHCSAITKQTPAEYCLNLVRKHDYENFLCTLLLPSEIRSAGFAIRAFNVEVAQVEDHVQDSKIGALRMKFWLDALNETYNTKPPRSMVFLELHRILQKHTLSKHYFKRLIDSRRDKLNNATFLNIEDIEKYAEYSTSSVYYLLLEAYGIKNINMDHAVSHMGKAHGIVTLIRSIPYNAKKRVNVMPQDILLKHSVSTESVLQGESSIGFRDAVYEIASCSKLHLDMVSSLTSKVEKKLGSIFLPTVCLEKYLEELRRADFNVFDPKLQKRDSLLPLRLLWRRLWIH